MKFSYVKVISVNSILDKGEFSRILSFPVESYFRSLGFYTSTMHPRFPDGDGYDDILTHGEPCLRKDFGNEYTVRIFMNKVELYMEVQTPWRSYVQSSYVRLTAPNPNILDLEQAICSVISDLFSDVWEDLKLTEEDFLENAPDHKCPYCAKDTFNVAHCAFDDDGVFKDNNFMCAMIHKMASSLGGSITVPHEDGDVTVHTIPITHKDPENSGFALITRREARTLSALFVQNEISRPLTEKDCLAALPSSEINASNVWQ